MKRIFFGVVGVIFVLLIALFTVPFLVPTDVYKSQIEKAATNALQREVTLNGDVSLSVFPRIAASVENVTVANPEGFDAAHMIEAGALRGSVKWMPLLSRKVDVQEIAFVDAKVDLHRRADGVANWEFGAPESGPTSDTDTSTGTVDAAIGTAKLINADLTYRDDTSGTRYDLNDLDLEASLKSLDEPLSANGEGVFQDQPFKLSLELDSPNALTSGGSANAVLDIESELANMAYDGAVTLGETPTVDGAFEFSSDELGALSKFANVEVPYDIARLGNVEVEGAVSGSLDALAVKGMEVTQKSDMAATKFFGDVSLANGGTVDGAVTFSTNNLEELVTFADVELPYDLARLGQVDFAGAVSGPFDALMVKGAEVAQSSDLAKTKYSGDISLAVGGTVNGSVAFSTKNLKALSDFANIETPLDITRLGGADVEATLSGPFENPKIDFKNLKLNGDLLTADYQGAVALEDAPVLDGRFSAKTPDAAALASAMGINVDALKLMNAVDITGAVSGSTDALKLNGMKLSQSGDLLSTNFNGSVDMGGKGRIAGNLNASSRDLRRALETVGVELTPGETLESFDISTEMNGSFDSIRMNDINFKVDDVVANGTGSLDLTQATPKITANITTNAVDLTPFMGEAATEQPKETGTAWSKEPLDLAGLNALNADVKLTAPSLKVGNVTLTDATLDALLNNGTLKADLSRFKTFGGNWSGNISVNTQNGTPTFAFDLNGDSVGIDSLLNTFAGFDRLVGTGGLQFKGTSAGDSIYDIVNGLDGSLSTNLSDGALRGINVSQLVRSAGSLREALASGNINPAEFASVLSPSAETDFTSFKSVLNIEDGVAKVNLMELINPVLGVDGIGEISIGGQSLDLRLSTTVDTKGQASGAGLELNGIPVPVRISGGWNKLSISPDTSGLQAALEQELKSRARDEIGKAVGDRLGGQAGGILGNVLGLPTESTTKDATDDSEQAAATPTDPRSILGSVLGGERTETAPEMPVTTEEQTQVSPKDDAETDAETNSEEDKPKTLEDLAKDELDNALGGLFGK